MNAAQTPRAAFSFPGCADHPPGTIDDGGVQQLPVERHGALAVRLGALERVDDAARLFDLGGARREAFVDGLDLLRMDERLADEAEETAPAGVGAQTILIGEVGPNAGDRAAAWRGGRDDDRSSGVELVVR